MPFGIKTHFKNSRRLNHLLKESPLLQDLFWYNRPISQFLGWKGIWRFLRFSLKGKKDHISANYNIRPLYWGPPIGDGLTASGATIWNHTKLKNDPIIRNDRTCENLEINSRDIIEEYKNNLSYIQTHPDNADLAKNGEWSGIFLYGVGGKRNTALEAKFPKTFKVVDSLPISKNYGFVLISKLSPGTHVLPHCGSSNLRFRYHLGLDIPEPDKVKIRVGRQWQSWQTGKAFGFDDSFEHEVKHEGSKARVVLIVDTWNPALTKEEITLLDDPVFHAFGKRG